MEAIKSFLKSVNLNNMRAALYAWLFNFLFSLIAYYGFYKLFATAAGESLAASGGDKGYSVFNILVDIFHNYKGSMVLLFSILLVLVILFFLVAIFSAGGIYSVLIEERKATFTNLFYSSAESYLAMLKIFLVNLLNWTAALIIPVFSMVLFLKPGILKINESLVPFFFYPWLIISALILIFSMAIYDFSRISRLQEERHFLYSFKEGIKFVFSNKLNILILFLLYGVSLIIIYLLYMLISGLINTLKYTILIFIIYQVFMFLRYYLKMALMLAEVKVSETHYEEE